MTNLEKNFDKIYNIIKKSCENGDLYCVNCPFGSEPHTCFNEQKSLKLLLRESEVEEWRSHTTFY